MAASILNDRQNIQFGVTVHLEGIGDRAFRNDQWAGTKAQGRRLEGFQINLDHPVSGLGLRYKAHLQGTGDTGWVPAGQFIGTRGQSLRLEGFAMELTGPQASNYVVVYRAHVQDLGDTREFWNGQFAGTRGQSLRVEAMFVSILPRGNYQPPPVEPVRDLRMVWGWSLANAVSTAVPNGLSWLGITRSIDTERFIYDSRSDRVDFTVTVTYKQKVFGQTLWTIRASVEGWINLSNPSPATFRIGRVNVSGVSGWDVTQIAASVVQFFRENASEIRRS